MSDNNPVVWFEIPVEDIGRAQTFYEAVLEIDLTQTDMGDATMAWFPMFQEGTGAAGSLIKGEGYTPSTEGTLVYLSVEDIEGALKRVEEGGGKTLQTKTSIGEHGFIGIFEDLEGNRVALHSRQ